ncbi:DUF5107 domain-containing protein [Nonomuraea thailandensis]
MTSTLYVTGLSIPTGEPPRASSLPILSSCRPNVQVLDADQEMRAGMEYGSPPTLLPYTRQEGYGRNRADRDHVAIVLENETLCATFLPEHGGRLWSLTHKPTGRDLLHRNPSCSTPIWPSETLGSPAASSGTSAPPAIGG